MDRKTVVEQVKKIFKDNISEEADLAQIYSGKKLSEISTVDSLAMLTVLVAIEKKFNIKFNINSLEEVFKDINSISDYIISKQK